MMACRVRYLQPLASTTLIFIVLTSVVLIDIVAAKRAKAKTKYSVQKKNI